MLTEGYAPVQIKETLHTTYFRIRRYATGDPYKLCRFRGDRDSEASQYKNTIVELLTQNILKKHILEQITALGYRGKRTAFEASCRRLIVELDIPYMPKRNAAGVHIAPNPKKQPKRYVSRSDVERYLWSEKELEPRDINFIIQNYPHVLEIQRCILDFRKIYDCRDVSLLESFLDCYAGSQINPIKSFTSGLCGDIEAVSNSVTSELNNGFVEGINNKIKAIKRIMYGRAKIDLLRVKVLFAR